MTFLKVAIVSGLLAGSAFLGQGQIAQSKVLKTREVSRRPIEAGKIIKPTTYRIRPYIYFYQYPYFRSLSRRIKPAEGDYKFRIPSRSELLKRLAR